MEDNIETKPKKKLITTLLSVIFVLLGITGGLAYANHIDFKYTLPVQSKTQFPENLSLTFGVYGTYKAVYDKEINIWTLGLWEEAMLFAGEKNITDLQTEGGVITFEMPWNGYINSSAGEIYIDGNIWENGNPVSNSKGKSIIKKGQKVEIRYGVENQSAGFQIYFGI